MDETPPCKTDPRAPHGFDRNASHSADRYVCECEGWEPLQREWVGLTDEEVDDIWNRYCDEMGEASINDAEDIARAIEAKLKEKNA